MSFSGALKAFISCYCIVVQMKFTGLSYARREHVSVALNSYTVTAGTPKVVSDISNMHKALLKEWIARGFPVKFIGDNVDIKINERMSATFGRIIIINWLVRARLYF